MTAFDNTKWDLALYPQSATRQGYRVKSYQKSEFSPFIPRLGSGDQSESEFDAIKSQTFQGFEGGQYARNYIDEFSQYAIEGMYPMFGDGVLWQVNHAVQQVSLFGAGKPYIVAHCRTKDYVFVAIKQTSGGSAQRITRYDSAGTAVNLTIAANLSGTTHTITDMVIHKNQLWVTAGIAGTATGSLHYMDLSSTTLTDITAGSGAYTKLIVWNGQLYGTSTGLSPNAYLYKYTGSTSTRSFQELDHVASETADYNARLLVFNGRIILARHDGIYGYDGIRLAPIEDATDRPNPRAFRFPSILKGYLYYWMPDGMYRYNGASIEKLYDVNDVGYPVDMYAAKNRLWVLFANSSSTGSSRYDKTMGYDYTTGLNFDGRLCAFDGKGMFTYSRFTSQTKTNPPAISNEGEPSNIIYNPAADRIYIATMADPVNFQWNLNVSESAITAAGTGTGSWQIVTPALDGKFPMVNKALASVELVLDGVPSADDTVVVEYRTSGFDGATGWTTLGNIKLSSKLKLNVFSDLPGGVTYKRLQLRVRPNTTTNTACGIAKLVYRYVLMPEFKYEWILTLNCAGDDPLAPLMLADGTESTDSVSQLRGNIYDSRNQPQPIIYVDIDQQVLVGALTTGSTSITLDDAKLLKSSGYVLIDDEIIYFASKSGNVLGGLVRGVFTTVNAAHSDAAKVFTVYATTIKRIINDRVSVDDRGTDYPAGKARMSEVSFNLQEL